MKKFLAILLTAILLCGLLTACGGEEARPEEQKKDTEDNGYIELILTDWMRYISAEEAMYEDMDWVISYIAAFGEQPEWNTLVNARAAVELAAKRIELREEPVWEAPEEAYDYFMDREVDVSFVQPELAGFETERQSLLTTCQTLRENLMSDVFTKNGLSRMVDTVAIHTEDSELTLTYLALTTDYLLLQLDDAEWTEKVHESMQEFSPRIHALRSPALTTGEDLENAVFDTLESLSAVATELTSLIGGGQAELDLMREYIARGDTASIIARLGSIEGLPTLLPDPGWNLTEASYLWTNEDGTRRYLTKKEDLTSTPEQCVLKFSDVTEEETAQYLSLLYDVLGLSGNRMDGEDGCYDVYFSFGDSVLAVSWTGEGADIYLLENPVCLAPGWFFLANQT